MKKENPLHIIKVKPFHREGDGKSGKPTSVSFYEDRIEYKVDFKQRIPKPLSEDDEEDPILKDSDETEDKVTIVVDHEGVQFKDSITGFSKVIENEQLVTGETFYCPAIEIYCNSSNIIYISCLEEKDRDNLYDKLKAWKLNKDLKEFE